MVTFMRRLHVWVLLAFFVLVLVQFFLAGLAVFGGKVEAHAGFGWAVLHTIVPVLMLLTVGLGRMGWKMFGLVLGYWVLLTVQILAQASGTLEVKALHPALALVVIAYVYFVMLRAARALAPHAPAAAPPHGHTA